MLKLLIPVYEEGRDFKQLSAMHLRMHQAYKSVVDAIESGKRIFATYYRLSFYGDAKLVPPELLNKHFIYREKGLVTLSEVTQRVQVWRACAIQCNRIRRAQKIYSARFRPECFELISDSKPVDEAKLALTSKAYVQVQPLRC